MENYNHLQQIKDNDFLEPSISHQYKFETVITQKKGDCIQEKKWIRNSEIINLERERNYSLYQILCHKIKLDINKKKRLHNLFEKIVTIFDTLLLKVNLDGKITNIINLEEVQRKFETITEQIIHAYEGAHIEKYLKNISLLLKREECIINFLSEYKMYGFFFNPITWNGPFIEEIIRYKTEDTLYSQPKIKENWKTINHPLNKNNFSFYVSGNFKRAELLEDKKYEYYRGAFIYKNRILQDGLLEIKYQDTEIKHLITWLK